MNDQIDWLLWWSFITAHVEDIYILCESYAYLNKISVCTKQQNPLHHPQPTPPPHLIIIASISAFINSKIVDTYCCIDARMSLLQKFIKNVDWHEDVDYGFHSPQRRRQQQAWVWELDDIGQPFCSNSWLWWSQLDGFDEMMRNSRKKSECQGFCCLKCEQKNSYLRGFVYVTCW